MFFRTSSGFSLCMTELSQTTLNTINLPARIEQVIQLGLLDFLKAVSYSQSFRKRM